MQKNEMVQKYLVFLENKDPQIIAYQLKDNANQDKWKQIVVIFNGSETEKKVVLPEGTWKAALKDYHFKSYEETYSDAAGVAPYSAMILYKE
jgi:pullulanase